MTFADVAWRVAGDFFACAQKFPLRSNRVPREWLVEDWHFGPFGLSFFFQRRALLRFQSAKTSSTLFGRRATIGEALFSVAPLTPKIKIFSIPRSISLLMLNSQIVLHRSIKENEQAQDKARIFLPDISGRDFRFRRRRRWRRKNALICCCCCSRVVVQ